MAASTIIILASCWAEPVTEEKQFLTLQIITASDAHGGRQPAKQGGMHAARSESSSPTYTNGGERSFSLRLPKFGANVYLQFAAWENARWLPLCTFAIYMVAFPACPFLLATSIHGSSPVSDDAGGRRLE